MVEYQSVGDGLRHSVIDRDLRRRLMARVGCPLTASAVKQELSGMELVADNPFDSLVSSVYAAARA